MRSRLALVLLAGSLAFSGAALGATPPPQPKAGAGGADYAAGDVVKRAVGRASAATYVFHRAGTPDQPRPVAVFLHAWGATNPQIYGGWIEHLARKGYLVLYPRFQELNRTRPAEATAQAVGLLKDAFAQLGQDAEAKPDLGRVVLVGHSAGAALAFNLAAKAAQDGLPVPKLVLGTMPGGVAKDEKSRGIVLEDLSRIDPATLLVTVIGDREWQASDRTAKRLMREASSVPLTRKVLMRAPSDEYGFPTLAAALASPGSTKDAFDGAKIKLPPDPPVDPKAPKARAPKWSADMVLSGEQSILVAQLGQNVTDSVDYYAFWKTLDLAATAAFEGKDGETLRKDAALTDMGRWSDGWPVKRLSAEAPKPEAPATAQPAAAPVATGKGQSPTLRATPRATPKASARR
ncbi:MAG TPA: alpha/beta hydrolase [Beijerinckiaceae bacterium]|jgi:pimeloyl-ACP methyl ester carboxylesterase